jgi:phosphohistidine phosphatase
VFGDPHRHCDAITLVQLLVIRHAIAVDRTTFAATGKDDDLRPLTDDGSRKMGRAARGLQRVAGRPDVLATSPLTRAQQTAKIVADVYAMTVSETVEALRPDSSPSMFADWAKERNADAIAIVGHEPHLSELVSWLMCGAAQSHVALKKGGACLLAFDGPVRRSGGTLKWLLTPAQLRQLGD